MDVEFVFYIMRRAFYLTYKAVVYFLFSDNWLFVRKMKGGKWYLMRTTLPMADIWSQIRFTNCQAKCIKVEMYGKHI